MTNNDIKPDDLTVSIKSMESVEKRIELVVRFSNKATRAVHYIAEVRATRYDPSIKTLTLSLSDEGRQVIPSITNNLPVFRHIDPGSEAEIRLSVPDRVIKLSRTVPHGELAFETHQLSDVEEVIVEVAWADVPFYKETRPRMEDDTRLPAARWEQHKARTQQSVRRRLRR